ncbi:hypothetical protein TWF788_001240 [Orbilia oligospora]|uniref:Wax synthase domain-containing protein n=1 Tax=Orbilia oligospora TaxID=2813651 RepID=A0A7C8K5B7_ORBOL|nr:hypothetical protein TWF788_001240 [Orbilia oligospora]
MAAAAVLVGISRPEDWPPVLGPVQEAYSLRRFWAKTWHQLFRNIFEKYGLGLVGLLGLEPLSKEVVPWSSVTILEALLGRKLFGDGEALDKE